MRNSCSQQPIPVAALAGALLSQAFFHFLPPGSSLPSSLTARTAVTAVNPTVAWLATRFPLSLGGLVSCNGVSLRCLLFWPSRLRTRLPAGSPWTRESRRWSGGGDCDSGGSGALGAPGVRWPSCAVGSEWSPGSSATQRGGSGVTAG